MLFVESQFNDGRFHPYWVTDECVELCEALVEVSQYVFVLQIFVDEHFGAETLLLFFA